MKIVDLLRCIRTGSERANIARGVNTISKSIYSVRYVVFTSLCLIVRAIHAQSLIEQIGWKGADSKIIISVIFVFFIGFLLLLFFYFLNKYKGKIDQREFSDQLFNEYVDKAELTPYELKMLNKLVLNVNISDRSMIFQSIAIFEQCLDLETHTILAENTSPKELVDYNMLLSGIRKKLGYNYLPYENPLVSSRNIEVGQKVSLYTNGSKQISQGSHAIVTMNQEFTLRLQVDFDQGENIFIHRDDFVKLAFSRQGDGIYGIDMKVNSFDDSSILELQHTLEMKRNQLRQFVRIEVNFPLKIRIVKAVNDDDKQLVGKQFEAKVIDISGGGLSFLLNKPLVPGEVITMNFQLSTATFSGQTGRILRVSLIDGKTSAMYRHHVTFSEIGQSSREKIIKYVFEKQRQLNQWR